MTRLALQPTSLALSLLWLVPVAHAQMELAASPPPTVMVPSAANAPATITPSNRTGQSTTINLQGADISALIQTVSEITGKTFIVDPGVVGKVTVISGQQMRADEVYELFQSVLRVHGYAAVPSGNVVKIVPEAIAAQDGGASIMTNSGVDELVTQVIEVKHVSAQELVTLLRPLMPQQGHMIAHGNSNSLLVTDRAGNVERLRSIIRRIDTSADVEVEVIPLRHASAAEVGRTVLALEPQSGAAAAAPGAMKLIADARTNSILLSGDRAQRLRMRALVAHLDTPLESGENTQVIYLRYAKAAELVPILEGVADTLTGTAAKSEGANPATIQPHEGTNALIITSSPAVFRDLSSVVRQLDVPSVQILVEAIIAEVSDDLADELGVQWQTTTIDSDGNGGLTSGVIGGTNFPGAGGTGGIVGALTNPYSAVGGGLNLGYLSGTVTLPGSDTPLFQIGALVKALRGDARANMLSNPSIVTLDHKQAEFKVVQEVPFLTGQFTNTGAGGSTQPTNPFQTIERKDVGLILTVTPHVNEGSSVRLDLKQEVSSLAPGVAGASDLITNKRELTTSVMVPDGGLLVLGGLTSEETTESLQGVPGLSRIPVLGGLFKSRSAKHGKRNLMVFLRPRILRDEATTAAISSERYNFLRAEQQRMSENKELRYNGDKQPMLPELPEELFLPPPAATTEPLRE
ncbi:MAG: type II secretion system secretin GspD [Pseudomarimonas sp.]